MKWLYFLYPHFLATLTVLPVQKVLGNYQLHMPGRNKTLEFLLFSRNHDRAPPRSQQLSLGFLIYNVGRMKGTFS